MQVYQALQAAEASLPAATRELFIGRVQRHRIYLPRTLIRALCCAPDRPYPVAGVRAVASAARRVARLQLSLQKLLEDGLSEALADVMQERFPAALLPQIVTTAGQALQVCSPLHSQTKCKMVSCDRIPSL